MTTMSCPTPSFGLEAMILRMLARKGLKFSVAYGAKTAVTSSMAFINRAIAPGVSELTTNWRMRKPIASEMAVVRETPRTARFATAVSHRAAVISVLAAKTMAYCFRNDGDVRSNCVVFWIRSSIFRRNQILASVSFWSRNPRGALTKSMAALASQTIGM
ncbi:hypothetical protein ACFU99_05320 [Streptomyces sp. NPDC057654]|uniref:hypothetical protein n=1 Tax=Streptomyces sp. NPDC057654 TaxID=3346196 RepID=UPI00368CB1D5